MGGGTHRWLGDKKSWPIALIDDATSDVHAEFFNAETTLGCLKVLRDYIKRRGLFKTRYVHRAGLFSTPLWPLITFRAKAHVIKWLKSRHDKQIGEIRKEQNRQNKDALSMVKGNRSSLMKALRDINKIDRLSITDRQKIERVAMQQV